jgi:hypothetical protein
MKAADVVKFLMDEDLTFRKPERITTEQAATIGVGLLVRWPPILDVIARAKLWHRLQP